MQKSQLLFPQRRISFFWRVALCSLPGVALFLIFWVYPICITIYYSFVESAFRHTFVGIQNYVRVWNNAYYQLAVSNSLRFSLVAVPLTWTAALILAICLEKLPSKSLLGFLLLPFFIPTSATTEIWTMLFPGEKNALISLISVFLWKNIGFTTLLLRVGLSNVSASSREAASLEGAGFWRTLWHIVLPQMADQSFFTAMLLLSWAMRIFKDSYALYGAYPPENVYMVQNYINNQFTKFRYPNMTAASLVTMFIISIIAVLWAQREKQERIVQ